MKTPYIFGAGLLMSIMACSTLPQKTSMQYPDTKKQPVEDTYFGEVVSDPYRWLEDDRSAETKDWVSRQAGFTKQYLAKIPARQKIYDQLQTIWNYEKVSAPFREGKYLYFYKNDGLQSQSVLYRKDEQGNTEVFLDPNKFSKDGTTSLSGISFNKKGTLAAYRISEGGSDWNKIIIIDTETGKQIDETLTDVKFTGSEWLGDEGIFYSRYDKPTGSQLSAKTDMHKVYFHRLGTQQSQDELILGDEQFKRRYISANVSEDQRYLIISAANATNGNELYIRDLSKKNAPMIVVQTGFDINTSIVDNVGETFYAITDKDAPNMRLVKFDLNNPQQWTDVIPESEEVLRISTAGGYLFANYMQDAVSVIKQYGYDGKLIRQVTLPGKGTVSGFSGKKEDSDIYYSFSNYVTPATIYRYDAKSNTSSVYNKPQIKFDPSNYVSEQVFYTSKDGTRIPMMISYKKGLKKNGKNPTMLYSYGGFNISLQPAFSVVNAVWMENGGIYAVPNIRGGGEYGKKWHDAGTKLQKKNVFDDFISAAEYLHKNGYTSPAYTALSGRSNGGLLVGATMTMRPELAQVAFPGVVVLDMLRYNKFTAGAGWAYDYGTAEDSREMFDYLKSYSPVHNVKKGTCYPATMVITSDHDDRVVPAHSFKFGAALQAAQACQNPILLRIEQNAGHGAGRSTAQVIGENADMLSFALYQMGL